ncbi:TPA: hypothetical protein ACLT9F_001528, partial [Neisseria gonorrhoeae]
KILDTFTSAPMQTVNNFHLSKKVLLILFFQNQSIISPLSKKFLRFQKILKDERFFLIELSVCVIVFTLFHKLCVPFQLIG